MDSEAVITVSASIVALTQFAKWRGVDKKHAPAISLCLSLVGVFIWAFSTEPSFDRTKLFEYFASWIAIATSAAGVWGFTKSTPDSITNLQSKQETQNGPKPNS